MLAKMKTSTRLKLKLRMRLRLKIRGRTREWLRARINVGMKTMIRTVDKDEDVNDVKVTIKEICFKKH